MELWKPPCDEGGDRGCVEKEPHDLFAMFVPDVAVACEKIY